MENIIYSLTTDCQLKSRCLKITTVLTTLLFKYTLKWHRILINLLDYALPRSLVLLLFSHQNNRILKNHIQMNIKNRGGFLEFYLI